MNCYFFILGYIANCYFCTGDKAIMLVGPVHVIVLHNILIDLAGS